MISTNTWASLDDTKHPILAQKLALLSSPQFTQRFALPLTTDTQYVDGHGTTHLYLLANIAYARFANFFSQNTWCNALILQIHIKACRQYEHQRLDIYFGSDDYAEPSDVFKFDYDISDQQLESDYLQISMSASDGPLDSHDYRIRLEITPATDNKSLVHFFFQADYGFFSRMAINTYLLTAGRHKIGFGILNPEADKPIVYQTGMKGILERNAMRYVLAFLSYLEINPKGTTHLWLDKSLRRWHQYTLQFYQQLYEMPLEEFLQQKNKEYNNQVNLENPNAQQQDWPDD